MPKINKKVFEDTDIFSGTEVHSSVTGEMEIEYYPINPLVSGEPIQFDVPETFSQLTDPNFLLKISCKIQEGDGTILKDNARVATSNLTLHAIFKDVVLKANGIIINQATGTYPYRAYIETNFTYSSAAKKGAVGIPQLFYKDTPGKFDSTTKGVNDSFDKRAEKFAKSAEVIMAGRLHCDLLLQNKLIIPGVRFSISLFPSDTKFHILSGTANPAEKLKLTSIILKVRRLNLGSGALLSIERSLQSKPAQYPVNHAVVRTTQLTPGQTQLSNFVVNNGQVPRLVIVTLTESTGFAGSYVRNPFKLAYYGCLSAQMSVGGKLYPPLPYRPKDSAIEPYLNSLRMVKKLYTDSDTGLTLDDFIERGHQILPFDLSPEEGGNPAKTNGVVTFSGQWGDNSIDQNMNVLFYILWSNTISIDGRRNIILDYIP